MPKLSSTPLDANGLRKGVKILGFKPEYATDAFSPKMMCLVDSSRNGKVIARMPPELEMSIEAEWSSLLNFGFSKIFNFVASEAAGINVRTRFATLQVWGGSSPLEITLPLEFYATKDPETEVLDPILALMAMALPSATNSGKGFFLPPGERVLVKFKKTAEGVIEGITNTNFASANNSDQICIHIGDIAFISDLIVTRVVPKFNTRDIEINTGEPLRASVDVTFRSLFTLTREEMFRMFQRPPTKGWKQDGK